MNTLEDRSRVGVTCGSRRRGVVARALALVADDLRAVARARVRLLIEPLARGRGKCPHPDAFSALLDALCAAGTQSVVAGGFASDALARFEALGFRREAWGRPVDFVAMDPSNVGRARFESDNDVARVRLTNARDFVASHCDHTSMRQRHQYASKDDSFTVAVGAMSSLPFSLGSALEFAVAGDDAAAVAAVTMSILGRDTPAAGDFQRIAILGDMPIEGSRPSHGRRSAVAGPHAPRVANEHAAARPSNDSVVIESRD